MLVMCKTESDLLMKNLNLNRITEDIFYRGQDDKVRKYLIENPFKHYNLRDKGTPGGKFFYKLTAKQVLEVTHIYPKFSLFESLAQADDLLVLQGEISISEQFKILASLDDRKGISNREAMQNPHWTLNSNDLIKRKYSIPGLNKVIDYIACNELFDVIVEFSMYDVPVGVNQENLLIWELRSY
jgi:hypothetical protein